jgi:DNA-binding transcriptional ArsR family regulator
MNYESAQKVAEVLKAVAHPVRLQIVAALEHQALCVADIMEAVGGKQAMTSQQLNMMRNRGVLEARREGNKVFYSIANPNEIKLLDCMVHHCDQAQKTS